MVPKLRAHRKMRGRGAFSVGGRCVVKHAGPQRSDYADISNVKTGEKPVRRKPKVSWVKVIFPGLVGS